jgi:hypothetical protein
MENTHTPEVGQIRVNESGATAYYKITKLSAKMLWYFRCDKHGSPLNSDIYKIWIKNADLFLGEPLETHEARKEAERHAKVLQAIQDSHDKLQNVYKALS